MATQQEITDAIDAADQQLNAIADQIRARPNIATQEGDWTVRELLCHIAATSNYDQLILRVEKHGGVFPTLDQMAEDNRQQLAERTGRSIDDLLEEASQGHANARSSVRELTDAQLTEPALASDDSPMTVSDLIMIVYEHAQGHTAILAQAVGAQS